jgi:hypothetical protein
MNGGQKLVNYLIVEVMPLSRHSIHKFLVKRGLNRLSLRKSCKIVSRRPNMKIIVMSVCAVIVAFVALPVFAADQAEGKDDCLVYGKNCPNVVDSLPERIAKLKAEIAKGIKVYTAEELKLLERRLKEDNETMWVLNKPGGRK